MQVSYTHTIGEVQQVQTTNAQWTPDLFAAVSREHSQRIVSVSVVNASLPPPMASLPPPIFSAFDYRGTVGFTATIGAISIVAGYFGNTATATIFNALSPELMTASNGTLIWQPTRRSAKTLSVAVSDLPPSATATLLITTNIALAESGRLASVRFEVEVANQGNVVLARSQGRILITLLPPFNANPYVLTITQNIDSILTEVIRDPSGGQGALLRIVDIAGAARGNVAYMITVVQGSEQVQSTLYAKADMPFDMPGFSPPSFPQMAELAFAANPRISPSFPPFYRHSRVGGNPTAPLARS